MQHEPNATDAPAVLKISEVISVMRISRTAAYEGARNFLGPTVRLAFPASESAGRSDSRASKPSSTASTHSPPSASDHRSRPANATTARRSRR